MTLHYTAGPEDASKTLFYVLRYRLRISAGQIKRLKYQTKMLVNGMPVHTDYRICSGDVIELPLPEEHASFPPEPGHLHILYEDDALIAVHKPAGIIIHPSATRNTGTLANQILFHLEKGTVHPVNRLDRDTTGVTVFAKNGYIKSVLTETLRTANIFKTYLAPVFGRLPDSTGVIDLPIDRINPNSLWRTIREEGQPSRTAYELLSEHDQWALYAFHPLTGRTHQIRLHCFASGAPILGDPVYRTEDSELFSASLGLSTQQLCCVEMTFPHPTTGKMLSIITRPEFYDLLSIEDYPTAEPPSP